jgi:hypothetical protein
MITPHFLFLNSSDLRQEIARAFATASRFEEFAQLVCGEMVSDKLGQIERSVNAACLPFT